MTEYGHSMGQCPTKVRAHRKDVDVYESRLYFIIFIPLFQTSDNHRKRCIVSNQLNLFRSFSTIERNAQRKRKIEWIKNKFTHAENQLNETLFLMQDNDWLFCFDLPFLMWFWLFLYVFFLSLLLFDCVRLYKNKLYITNACAAMTKDKALNKMSRVSTFIECCARDFRYSRIASLSEHLQLTENLCSKSVKFGELLCLCSLKISPVTRFSCAR